MPKYSTDKSNNNKFSATCVWQCVCIQTIVFSDKVLSKFAELLRSCLSRRSSQASQICTYWLQAQKKGKFVLGLQKPTVETFHICYYEFWNTDCVARRARIHVADPNKSGNGLGWCFEKIDTIKKPQARWGLFQHNVWKFVKQKFKEDAKKITQM